MKPVRYPFTGLMSEGLFQGISPAQGVVANWVGRVSAPAIGDRGCRIQLLREAYAVLVRRGSDQGAA